MNKTRFSFFAAAISLLVLTTGLRAQTSVQRLTFSLFAPYQTNTFATNTSSGTPLTNEYSKIKNVLIATGNIIKAVAIDLEGTNWTIWAGAELAREVNLTNGAEGIYLRKGTNSTNVSAFFPGFSNNFTAGLSNAFPAFSNNIYGQATNNINGMTNNIAPSFNLYEGVLRMTGPTNFTTNYSHLADLHFISLNTANIKFNFLGLGEDGTLQTVAGRASAGGTLYSNRVESEIIAGVGTYFFNGTSNVFGMGAVSPVSFTGPLRGSLVTGTANFAPVTGP